MIELGQASALTLYLFLSLGGVLGLWIYSAYFSKKKTVSLDAEELLICEYCHFAYLGDRLKTVTECPCCRLYNKGNRYRG